MEIEKSDRSRISGICEYFGQMKQAKKCGYENFILSKLYLNFQKSTKLTNRLKMLEIITLIIKIIRPFLIYLFCLWRFLEKGNQLKLEIALPFILVAEIGQVSQIILPYKI